MADSFSVRPIGAIRSRFREQEGIPIQPSCAKGVEGTIELEAVNPAALVDLDGFDRI